MSQIIREKQNKKVRQLWWAVSSIGFFILASLVLFASFLGSKNAEIPEKEVWNTISDGFKDSVALGLMVNVASSIIVGYTVVFIIKRFQEYEALNSQALMLGEIERIFKNYQHGLKPVSVEEALFEARNHLRSAKEGIRAIGTAKTELLDTGIKDEIKTYLKVTEETLSNHINVSYRRITSYDMNIDLKNHLKECLKRNPTHLPRGKYPPTQVLLMDDFAPAYTYLAIDDQFLMLSLTASDMGDTLSSHSCYITTSQEIVKVFRDHFKELYKKERSNGFRPVISTISDMEAKLEEQRDVIVRTNQIKGKFIDLLNKPWLNKLHAKKILGDVESEIKGLSKGKLEIHHSTANSDLLSMFKIYIDQLESEDEYKTVSFYQFWSSILSHTGKHPFLISNEKALDRGAMLYRILIVDNKFVLRVKQEQRIDDASVEHYLYRKGIIQAIQINLKLANSYPKHYNFRILFVDNHEDLRKRYFHFALIEKIVGESKHVVVFAPVIDQVEKKTEIILLEAKLDIGSIIPQPYLDKLERLQEIKEMLKQQTIDEGRIEFLADCNATFGISDWNLFLRP